MISGLISLYSWRYPKTVIYMLQSCDYRAKPYLRWYWQTTNFSRVATRRSLEMTRPAQLLLLVMYGGQIIQLLTGLVLLGFYIAHGTSGSGAFGLALILLGPILWAHLIVVPLSLGRLLLVKPRSYFLVKRSERIFKDHPGVKIAVTGSYGKTTMKELLATVLGVSKVIAVTPGNKNVAVSHAYFAQRLTGREDILIIEYGEWGPGDVLRFAWTTHPTHAVITGLAPAHLDRYKTIEVAGEDIFSVADFVKPDQVYVNADSPATVNFMKKDFQLYSGHGALGWKVESVHSAIEGLTFTMRRGKDGMKIRSGLVGKHQIGPLALVAALAVELGLQTAEVEEGMLLTRPFEHRMQPYLLNGAWIIDDTYNGNIEGVRVGTELLKELPAKRKIYVTPGLVDQGAETITVHEQMGRYIATAKPDVVVLMKNSVTGYLQEGLRTAKYKGEIIIEDNPLQFYTSLNVFVATGDLVLMQNDWPDNYS